MKITSDGLIYITHHNLVGSSLCSPLIQWLQSLCRLMFCKSNFLRQLLHQVHRYQKSQKLAAYGRVLTSTENLKIIDEQEKERELKNKQKHKGKKSPSEDIPLNLSGLDYNAIVLL